MLSIRQQMDESNHEMANMLTRQIDTLFNPLIHNTNQSYQLLANQMGRIANSFDAPQTQGNRVAHVNQGKQQHMGFRPVDKIIRM